jgi:integrative and conjugative element protein (TIGR02256 family)
MILINPFDQKNSRLLIEDIVLSDVGAFRQVDLNAAEAGGILLGFRRGSHLHVTMATPPGPTDVRNKFSFSREDESHPRIALSEWSRSEETMDYIGEWHTHPEPDPLPSSLDLREWRKISRERAEPMVFMIQGILGSWIGLGVGRVVKVATHASETEQIVTRSNLNRPMFKTSSRR